MSTLRSVVTDCRMEQTKAEFALHRLLFHHGRGDTAGAVKSIGQARRALLTECRQLRRAQRALLGMAELAGERKPPRTAFGKRAAA